jgi:hypothetical protein
VFFVQCGTLASNCLQVGDRTWRHGCDIVHISGGARKLVEGGQHEAAQAMKFYSRSEKPVNVLKKRLPSGWQNAGSITQHI